MNKMEQVGHRMGKPDLRAGRDLDSHGGLPGPKPGYGTRDNPQNPTFQVGE